MGNRRDYGAAIGLEDIRAHTRHVANVIAHVVGDDAGIARVVLGNAGFQLTHQVRAHVGALGENTAADTGKERHAGGAHTETVNRVGGLGVAAEEKIQGAEPQQSK
jgi:hypothetical protein